MTKLVKRNLKIIAILAIIMTTLCMLSGCGKKEEENKKGSTQAYEQPLKNMFEGMQEGSVEKYISAFPDFMELESYFNQDYMDYIVETLEADYGTDIKIDYEITNKEEISEEDLNEVESAILENYEKTIDLTAGYVLSVDANVTGSEVTTPETESSEVSVYEIDGNWYILGL